MLGTQARANAKMCGPAVAAYGVNQTNQPHVLRCNDDTRGLSALRSRAPLWLSYDIAHRPRSNPYAAKSTVGGSSKGLSMLDLLYVAIDLAGFAVCLGYVRLCEFL